MDQKFDLDEVLDTIQKSLGLEEEDEAFAHWFENYILTRADKLDSFVSLDEMKRISETKEKTTGDGPERQPRIKLTFQNPEAEKQFNFAVRRYGLQHREPIFKYEMPEDLNQFAPCNCYIMNDQSKPYINPCGCGDEKCIARASLHSSGTVVHWRGQHWNADCALKAALTEVQTWKERYKWLAREAKNAAVGFEAIRPLLQCIDSETEPTIKVEVSFKNDKD